MTTPASKCFGGLLDNRARGRVADFLDERVASGSALSIVSAYFTIHAYGALASRLDAVAGLRFLFGEPRFIASLDPEKNASKAFEFNDQGLQLANQLQQREIARRCAAWIESKVEIRSVRKSNLLHGKLYHIDDGRREHAVLGSSNFTLRGLGLTDIPNIELNLVVDSDRDRSDLKAWFDEIWTDEQLVEDVKDEVLRYLEQLYVDHAPEFVYFKTLFHIFERFLTEQAEEAQLFDQVAITETGIWRALYDFQRDGAKGAIHKISQHNGCILADSVGLGKTYTALAVIKYFELRNQNVLVLCPKRLRENWTVFLAQNNSELNPFLRDRFAYTVLSHTDLSRESGMVDGVKLETLQWGNYGLVVIDESHNFRNDTRGRRDEDGNLIKKSRYERLMQDIVKSGIKTKVLLLSATPVNNNLRDLRNQIYFATEGSDSAFATSLEINSINETLATAQKVFKEWARQPGEKDAATLMESLSSAFFTLLDELTIARSRKHIQKYYASSVAQMGQFPRRLKPQSIYADIDLRGRFLSYDRISEEIDKYALSLFNPSKYLLPEFRAIYEEDRVRNFSQERREQFLIGMMKVNFLKRLESSVRSFAITMDRTIGKIEHLERKLNAFLNAGNSVTGDVDQQDLFESDEEDEDLAAAAEVGGKKKFQIAHLRVKEWLKDLAKDKQQLALLAHTADAVDPANDGKLARLRGIIEEKVQKPASNSRGEPIRKVIVFCAFADSAAYLYENLESWAQEELGLHIAMVSGGARPNRTTFGAPEYGKILTNFAPRAKQRAKMPSMPQEGEIDLLIATDCISEGQNLQDCDLIVNYDIHWNPVRIIQRFGRIDRLGSLNSQIQLVNFWPTPDLNKYINLKNRVEARMALVDIAATAEDNVLRSDDLQEIIQEDMRYRDKQLLRLRDEVLDLEDFHDAVSLNEFTLDDFRMELAAYIKANEKQLRDAPFGIYAVAPSLDEPAAARPGVIYCLRQRDTAIHGDTINPLSPYFLVYIRDDGQVRYNFTSPKQTLELFRALCQGRSAPLRALCDRFDAETDHGRDMSRHSALLESAARAIASHFGQKNVANLFAGRAGKLTDADRQVRGAGDLELVTWLVIQEAEHAER